MNSTMWPYWPGWRSAWSPWRFVLERGPLLAGAASCAAVGARRPARRAQGAPAPTPLGGGVAIWLTTVGISGSGMLVVFAWRPGRLARAAGPSRRRVVSSAGRAGA